MIFDISQELTKCNVYPNDPSPLINKIYDMDKGDLYNLSNISMCAHNGTHLDAPAHFIKNGKTIDQIPLEYFVGDCLVVEAKGNLLANDAKKILNIAKSDEVIKRLLIKGDCVVTTTAAKVFSNSDLLLIGIESQSFGPTDSPMEVHKILLNKNIVLLEGLILKNIEIGKYFLCAQPLNAYGIEGSPCRAILIK